MFTIERRMMPNMKSDIELCEQAGFRDWCPGLGASIEREGRPIFVPAEGVGGAEAEFNAVALMSAIQSYPKVLRVMEKVVAYRAVYMAYAESMMAGDLSELGDIVLDDAKSMYEIFDLLKRYKIS